MEKLLAAAINLRPGKGLAGQVENLQLSQVIGGLLVLILVVAALVFFFILVIGGVKWIMSGGDKAQTEAARNQITAALVGLVIVFSSWAIANLIEAFFGVSILNLEIPTVSDIAPGGV